jgi:guanylate kinase
MKGILFVLSGPSGTGKGTVCKKLLESECELFLSVSATTRSCREGEVEGETYYYVLKEEFESMIEKGDMLEYTVYNGNYYGTPKKAVEDILNRGEDVLLEIEPNGALDVKRIFPEAVLIFLVPPSMAELKNRLLTRGRESVDEIEARIKTAKWELTQAPQYTTVIENGDLDKCTAEVLGYINMKRKEKENIQKLINEQV